MTITAPLQDPQGRMVHYLRVSVTDRCDFRCRYCMQEKMTFLPKSDVLTLEEMEHICEIFIKRGVKKIRITGGEPLVRKGVGSLFEKLGSHIKAGGLDELTLTTNASQLPVYARQLASCGVRRVNISLDSLQPERFRHITRIGELHQTMGGVVAAKEAGLKVKINMVVVQGQNDDEIDTFIQWCGDEGLDLVLIEAMPLGDIEESRSDQYLSLQTVRSRLEEKWTLSADQSFSTGGPARYWNIAETGGRIGFISPMSDHFCATCNRVRITCTGMLYPCLGDMGGVDLRAVLRSGGTEADLNEAINLALAGKPDGHTFLEDLMSGDFSVQRHMNVTGG